MDSTNVTTNETEPTQQTTVRYVREVVVNYRGRRRVEKIPVTTVKGAADWIRKIIPDNSREHVAALYLDGGHRIIGYAVVATGTATSCSIHQREVFQRAVLLGAVAVIIGHNHPSGGSDPSPEDKKVTQAVCGAGKVLGIKVLDHVIVSSSGHYSFNENETLEASIRGEALFS